jgi:hypothetical protein
MAINPEARYAGKIAPSSLDYPYGSARNIASPGDGTGTPWEAALVNDIFGFQQALLSLAGVTPSGNPDKATASQYFEALWTLLNLRAITYNLTSDANYTLTADQNLYKSVTITDTGGVLTAGRDIIVDNIGKTLVFVNSTAQTLRVKPLSGAGVLVPAGASSMLVSTGAAVGLLTTSTPTADYELANKKYVDDTAGGNLVVVEANGQAEEDAAFLAGATIVIRLDLLSTLAIQLLLHMEGVQDGTTFIDSSPNNFQINRVGTPITETIFPKIGTASLNTVFGGVNYLSVQHHDNLLIGNKDFTVECYYRLSSVENDYQHFLVSKHGSGELTGWYLGILNGTSAGFYVDNGTKLSVAVNISETKSLTKWVHISINRIGNEYKLYLDGILKNTVVSSVTITENTASLLIGGWGYGTNNIYCANIDELVFVTGGALRTGDFTPPTEPIT